MFYPALRLVRLWGSDCFTVNKLLWSRRPLSQVGHAVQGGGQWSHQRGSNLAVVSWSLAMAPMEDCLFQARSYSSFKFAGNSGYQTIGHVQKVYYEGSVFCLFGFNLKRLFPFALSHAVSLNVIHVSTRSMSNPPVA